MNKVKEKKQELDKVERFKKRAKIERVVSIVLPFSYFALTYFAGYNLIHHDFKQVNPINFMFFVSCILISFGAIGRGIYTVMLGFKEWKSLQYWIRKKRIENEEFENWKVMNR